MKTKEQKEIKRILRNLIRLEEDHEMQTDNFTKSQLFKSIIFHETLLEKTSTKWFEAWMTLTDKQTEYLKEQL